jgi:hypothetical protein
MDKNTTIPVGMGKVTLDRSLREFAEKGYYIVIRMETVPGPCNDADCERIPVGIVEVTQVPDQSFKVYAGDGYFLAIEPPVQMYIDRDRLSVTLKKSPLGKLIVKGLVLT